MAETDPAKALDANAARAQDQPKPHAESDQRTGTDRPQAPVTDVMGEPGRETADVMGTRQPRADKAFGDDPTRVGA